MNYNLIFRVDSSNLIGSGHFMRCFNLALKMKEFKTTFICRHIHSNQKKTLKNQKINLLLNKTKGKKTFEDFYLNWLGVTEQIDAKDTIKNIKVLKNVILVVDSYSLSKTWLDILKPFVIKTIVIDDLANRKLNCDALIDHNYFKNYEHRYQNLVNSNCKTLLGPKFSLISDDLIKFKKKELYFSKLESILIYFGSSDNYNLTLFTLETLLESRYKKLIFKVILRKDHENFIKIQNLSNQFKNIELFSFTNNIGYFFKKCDLAIGAGGTTTWERILIGIPSLIITVAENQKEFVEDLDEDKIIYHLGNFLTLKNDDIINKIDFIVGNKVEVIKNLKRGQNLLDGKGLSRVKRCIINLLELHRR